MKEIKVRIKIHIPGKLLVVAAFSNFVTTSNKFPHSLIFRADWTGLWNVCVRIISLKISTAEWKLEIYVWNINQKIIKTERDGLQK